jgi:hypothetical protein
VRTCGAGSAAGGATRTGSGFASTTRTGSGAGFAGPALRAGSGPASAAAGFESGFDDPAAIRFGVEARLPCSSMAPVAAGLSSRADAALATQV